MSPAWKNRLANTAIVLVSLTLTYLVLSFVAFRILLPYLPLNVRPHFPELAEVLAQRTKADGVPHDYIALLGDSYAEGHGDWLLQAKGNRALPYSAAHVLHDLTRQDVITLGIGGAGSAEAMVRQPTRVLLSKNCIFFPQLEPPKEMFVLYYEGNDVEDNLDLVKRADRRYGGETQANVTRFIEEYYGQLPWSRCYSYLSETIYKMARFAFTNRDDWLVLVAPSALNHVMINGTPQPAAALQKPPLDIDEEKMHRAMLVYDMSLGWLKRHFPQSRITVVYIPSPAAIYHHAQQMLDVYVGDNLGFVARTDVNTVYAASERSCEMIQELTTAKGVKFVDLRPMLRAAASQHLIHGPVDWNHFNETGYRLLAKALFDTLEETANAPCRDWSVIAR